MDGRIGGGITGINTRLFAVASAALHGVRKESVIPPESYRGASSDAPPYEARWLGREPVAHYRFFRLRQRSYKITDGAIVPAKTS